MDRKLSRMRNGNMECLKLIKHVTIPRIVAGMIATCRMYAQLPMSNVRGIHG